MDQSASGRVLKRVDGRSKQGTPFARNGKRVRPSSCDALVADSRSTGQITGKGSCVIALRRNISNAASSAFGAAILENMSGQTVRRCEEHGACKRAPKSRPRPDLSFVVSATGSPDV